MSDKCKICGADIEWVSLRTGKSMPVNLRPVHTIVTNDGRVVSGRESHFSTCPKAKTWRGKQRADDIFSPDKK